MRKNEIVNFCKEEFERCEESNNTSQLLEELEKLIAKDIHKLIFDYLDDLVKSLNKSGHNLKLIESIFERKDYPVDISYRDEWDDSNGYHSKLRLAITSIISTGYSDFGKDE